MTLQKAELPAPLKPADLRWKCNPQIFEFESTLELDPVEGIVGQDRALRAIKLGVDLQAPGYNIYISGLSGTGKATTVKKMLEKISGKPVQLSDYAYVNNFSDPDRPTLLTFPAGLAKEFKKDIGSLIKYLREKVPQVLESETYTDKRKQVIQTYSNKQSKLVGTFEKQLAENNFSLGQIQVEGVPRPEIFPVIGEERVPIYELQKFVGEGKLTEENAQEFIDKYNSFQSELVKVFKQGMKLSQEMQQTLAELERAEVELLIKSTIAQVRDKYDVPKVEEYFNGVENSILENLSVFTGAKPEGEQTAEGFIIDYFRDYDVNIILDNSNAAEHPVIIEISPSYTNLFGTIEKVSDGRGGWYADFTRIKAGSLLKANGGYIVINVNHLFEEPGVWKTLKRVLTYRKLEIQDYYNYFQFSPSILKPEAIDIDAKVILTGSAYVYQLLAGYEDDFKKIFKVKADFDYEIENTGDVMVEYARVIKKMIAQENLLEFDKTAIAYLLELAARFAGRKNKLTARFSILADFAREADFWAKSEEAKVVTAKHVETAYDRARERHSLMEDKYGDLIKENTILIDTTGAKVGQVNGLAVYGGDIYGFGKPARITASAALGGGNIVNVERESGLSGKSHDKGIHIISGYFRDSFGKNFPLSFTANIVFEQSYGPIDGDSASCAEIFALLSALSGIPLKQNIAVTGSVNQKGFVQPIGGVNEKIEGFFSVCRERGLTGDQGVIIPVQNINDLMLKDEIISAVKKRKFSVYAITTISEGIEILTGFKAGIRQSTGEYAKNTVFGKVESNLIHMYHRSKHPFPHKEKEPAKTTEKAKQPAKKKPAAKPVKKKK
ncbi:MAG: AAA family ATPase [Ignavibacteriaceae bacterium]|nr:AAA family ATPase [Ignavibacteriaceae bacterium]